ncbi:hypothetical protein I7X12_03060 [Halosimplex litoreum]|uniref:Uncharacterized protein n=1 Tax=Halosimplex litoreum TaxID=1198301 RepID=A0A7T3FZR5_9EURY|nr:hypothetical protein [Halosimplex litoreum]QPV63626.1 hypothetical protein I7X12_03060 [Halosimplex litoreum]
MNQRTAQRYRSLRDGPPDADTGWIRAVEQIDPATATTTSRPCWHCEEPVHLGRDSVVEARACLVEEREDRTVETQLHLRFCSWGCWHEWATRC